MANDEGNDMTRVRLPRMGVFEINLNTIVVLVGFGAGLIAWGYALSEIRNGRMINAGDIARLGPIVTANQTANVAEERQLDNHELRITAIEKQMSDSAGTMKDIQSTLNDLASDMRVTKEIVGRIDASRVGARHRVEDR
jgi:hypothetical protein